ncbi:MAG: hypothetical protein MAG795_00322 [Candidatus Woesearchaeota archaeon]|nr:hypothetical protein [Candidatus Woesearchaeota archaeon]
MNDQMTVKDCYNALTGLGFEVKDEHMNLPMGEKFPLEVLLRLEKTDDYTLCDPETEINYMANCGYDTFGGRFNPNIYEVAAESYVNPQMHT